MKWNRLILLVLCATIASGGTFVCKSDNGAVVVHGSHTKRAPTSR